MRVSPGSQGFGLHLLGAHPPGVASLLHSPPRSGGWVGMVLPWIGVGCEPTSLGACLVAPIHIQLQGLARIGRICDPPRWIRLQKTCE